MSRLERSFRTLRSVREEQGGVPAVLFAARTLRRKSWLALRSILSVGQGAALRQVVKGRRQADGGGNAQLAVAMTGGTGDFVVIARFLRDLADQTGNLCFDVYCPRPEIAALLFAAVPGFRAAYHDLLFEGLRGDYDLALRVNQLAMLYGETVRWSALRRHPKLAAVAQALTRARPSVDDLITQHPYRDNFLGRLAVFQGRSRRDYLHGMANISYGGDQLDIPKDRLAPLRFGLRPKAYVTVHNGFDPDFIVAGQSATKCYPHFGAVVARLRAARPDLVFVQLGTTTSEPIPECQVNLVGRTNLREAAGLLAGSLLHLDNEGGLVHLARCFGTRAAVVFGPTPSDYFGYPDNINLDPPTCGGCWWLTRSWMDRCGKGYATARCMQDQPPEVVADRVLVALDDVWLPADAPPARMQHRRAAQ